MSQVEKVVEKYLNKYCIDREFTKATMDSKRAGINHFIKTMTIEDFGKLDDNSIRKYKTFLLSIGWKPRAINTRMEIIKAFLVYADNEGYKNHINWNHYVKLKTSKVIRRAYSKEEITQILSSCETTREILIVSLCYEGGLRKFEVAKLEKNDINGQFLTFIGKGNKIRTVKITRETSDLLIDYCRNSDSKYVFPSRRKQFGGKMFYPQDRPIHIGVIHVTMKKIAERSGFDGLHAHELRYSFATELYKNGAKMNSIRELLGHSSTQTTELYIQHSFSEVMDDYDKAFPQGLAGNDLTNLSLCCKMELS